MYTVCSDQYLGKVDHLKQKKVAVKINFSILTLKCQKSNYHENNL